MRWAALTVGAISLTAVALLIRSAVAVSFGFLVVPIVATELVFLAALYVLWRGLGEAEDASESTDRPRPQQGGPAGQPSSSAQRGGPVRSRRPRSLVGRTGDQRLRRGPSR